MEPLTCRRRRRRVRFASHPEEGEHFRVGGEVEVFLGHGEVTGVEIGLGGGGAGLLKATAWRCVWGQSQQYRSDDNKQPLNQEDQAPQEGCGVPGWFSL